MSIARLQSAQHFSSMKSLSNICVVTEEYTRLPKLLMGWQNPCNGIRQSHMLCVPSSDCPGQQCSENRRGTLLLGPDILCSLEWACLCMTTLNCAGGRMPKLCHSEKLKLVTNAGQLPSEYGYTACWFPYRCFYAQSILMLRSISCSKAFIKTVPMLTSFPSSCEGLVTAS